MKSLFFSLLSLIIFSSAFGSSSESRAVRTCILAESGPSCVQAIEQARGRLMSACYGVDPKCDGKGSDLFYEWTFSPIFKIKQVLREDKTTDQCYIEVAFEKSCQQNVRCKNPRHCPF